MPSSTSSSERRTAWRWVGLFGATWLLCGGLLLTSIALRAPYGDLTRIGALSEDQFGWRAPQPAIDAALLVSTPVAEADIVVVGDSFSVTNSPRPDHGLLWQSRLVQAGHRVATLHWDRAHPLCPDFDDWLRSLGFHGRWVLIESIEREINGRLGHDRPCSGPPRASGAGFTTQAPATEAPPPYLNWHEQLLTGVVTHWHSFQARRASAGPMTFRDPAGTSTTRLRFVADGCRRFTHALCDRVLFLADDEERPPLQMPHLDSMQARSAPPRPWRQAWIVVPNKTTFYLDAGGERRAVFARLPVRGLGPDVLAALSAAETGQRDLYFPNDTHLSTQGSLALGDAVAHWLHHADQH